MEIQYSNKQYFFIVDKVNGILYRIPLEKDKGVIRQVNEAYDNFLNGVNPPMTVECKLYAY